MGTKLPSSEGNVDIIRAVRPEQDDSRPDPAGAPPLRRGSTVGSQWPPAVGTGLGARALQELLDDRNDR